jgi:hypothetical protein
VIAMIAAPASALAATDDQVTVKLFPAEATLSAGDVVTVELVISNTTAAAMKVTALTIRVPDHVAVGHVPSPAAIGLIRSNSFLVRTFVLQALPGIESGEVDVLLKVRSSSLGKKVMDRLVTSSLTLKAGTTSQLPEAAFVSFPDKLNDGQSAQAAVRISNPTPFTLEQVQVAAVDSEDVSLRRSARADSPFGPCPAGSNQGAPLVGCLATLAPGGTAVLYLEVQADRRVQTGEQHVALVVASRTGTSGKPISTTVVATTAMQLTIFGVDALSPFGLGTLFVLPGLLTVLTFLLLARYVYPRSKELPDTVKFTDPGTMLYIVPPAALIYLLVWAVWGVNLTRQAGTADVALLFGLGVALGFAVWVVAGLFYYARSGRKQFRIDDSPERVLQRLEARHAGLMLPTVTTSNLSYRYLSDGPADKLVACSPTKYAFTADADQPARLRFRRALATDNIGVLRDEVRDNKVRLRWQLPTGVTLLDRSAGQLQAAAALITEEDLPDDGSD